MAELIAETNAEQKILRYLQENLPGLITKAEDSGKNISDCLNWIMSQFKSKAQNGCAAADDDEVYGIAKEIDISIYTVANIVHKLHDSGVLPRKDELAKGLTLKQKPIGKTVHCNATISKQCEYGMNKCDSDVNGICNYILYTGHRRGCDWKACTKFKKRTDGRRVTQAQEAVGIHGEKMSEAAVLENVDEAEMLLESEEIDKLLDEIFERKDEDGETETDQEDSEQ